MTNKETFQKLVAEGIRLRYGDHPTKKVMQRYLWEMKHIIDAGFVDYYLMAFWAFRHHMQSPEIGLWARGAVSSSIVCYALRLTEIDPLRYGLHSVRFVNEKPPTFQFDIECSRFYEFKKEIDEFWEAYTTSIDVTSIKADLFLNLVPMNYLSRKRERVVPEDLDDEIACYALRFPATMPLFVIYTHRKNGAKWSPTGIASLDEILSPTYGLLVYQEQMLDILQKIFHVRAIEANHIRIAIQREDEEQVKAYEEVLSTIRKALTVEEEVKGWKVLTSNPQAFLKAHAVSRVVATYQYEMY